MKGGRGLDLVLQSRINKKIREANQMKKKLVIILGLLVLFLAGCTSQTSKPVKEPNNEVAQPVEQGENATKIQETSDDKQKESVEQTNDISINVNDLKDYNGSTINLKLREEKALDNVMKVLNKEELEPPREISSNKPQEANGLVFYKFYYYENLKDTQANMLNPIEWFYVDSNSGKVYIENKENHNLEVITHWEEK